MHSSRVNSCSDTYVLLRGVTPGGDRQTWGGAPQASLQASWAPYSSLPLSLVLAPPLLLLLVKTPGWGKDVGRKGPEDQQGLLEVKGVWVLPYLKVLVLLEKTELPTSVVFKNESFQHTIVWERWAGSSGKNCKFVKMIDSALLHLMWSRDETQRRNDAKFPFCNPISLPLGRVHPMSKV